MTITTDVLDNVNVYITSYSVFKILGTDAIYLKLYIDTIMKFQQH